MNIPTFEILNELFVNDIKMLQADLKKNNINIMEKVAEKLSDKTNIIENFDAVSKFVDSIKDNKELKPEEMIRVQGVILYLRNYVNINNILVEKFQKEPNQIINNVILMLYTKRYNELLPLLEKKDYADPLTDDLISKVKKLLEQKEANKCRDIETTIMPVLSELMNKMIVQKKMNPQDDFEFATFAIGVRIVNLFLNQVFKIIDPTIQNTIQNDKNKEVILTKEQEKTKERQDADYLKDINN